VELLNTFTLLNNTYIVCVDADVTFYTDFDPRKIFFIFLQAVYE